MATIHLPVYGGKVKGTSLGREANLPHISLPSHVIAICCPWPLAICVKGTRWEHFEKPLFSHLSQESLPHICNGPSLSPLLHTIWHSTCERPNMLMGDRDRGILYEWGKEKQSYWAFKWLAQNHAEGHCVVLFLVHTPTNDAILTDNHLNHNIRGFSSSVVYSFVFDVLHSCKLLYNYKLIKQASNLMSQEITITCEGMVPPNLVINKSPNDSMHQNTASSHTCVHYLNSLHINLLRVKVPQGASSRSTLKRD